MVFTRYTQRKRRGRAPPRRYSGRSRSTYRRAGSGHRRRATPRRTHNTTGFEKGSSEYYQVVFGKKLCSMKNTLLKAAALHDAQKEAVTQFQKWCSVGNSNAAHVLLHYSKHKVHHPEVHVNSSAGSSILSAVSSLSTPK